MDLETGKRRRDQPRRRAGRPARYFHPDGKKVIFASSHDDPDAKKHQEAEYKQREEDAKKGVRRRYSWDFDPHMKIYEANPDGTGPEVPHPGRQGLHRRGELLGRRQADRLQLRQRRERAAVHHERRRHRTRSN